MPEKKDKINIGAFARWVIRQSIGTEKGNAVINLIEHGYGGSLVALWGGRYGDAWDNLPQDAKKPILSFVLSHLYKFLPFMTSIEIENALASLLLHQRAKNGSR